MLAEALSAPAFQKHLYAVERALEVGYVTMSTWRALMQAL